MGGPTRPQTLLARVYSKEITQKYIGGMNQLPRHAV